jgi:hypothetical protein
MELKQIKRIKIGSADHRNLWTYEPDEDGGVTYNIPTDVEEFRLLAIDTVQWLLGKTALTAAGGTSSKIDEVMTRGITLVSKAVLDLGLDTSEYSDNEKESFDLMSELYDNGYADNEQLVSTLRVLTPGIADAESKITDIVAATTIEDIIDVLNR